MWVGGLGVARCRLSIDDVGCEWHGTGWRLTMWVMSGEVWDRD